MCETFPEFLNQMRADPDMIQQALRIHLSERTNDLTRNEMLTELCAAVASKEELKRQLKELEQDPAALEQAALVYFEHAWQDDTQQSSIRTAFAHAKGKLPVVEMTILGIVAMYGMHLITTDGVTVKTIKKGPDGSYEETEKREPFSPIVAAMAQLFWKKR